MERLKIDLTKFLENTAIIHKETNNRKLIKYKELLKQTLKAGLIIEDEKISIKESVTIGLLLKKSISVVPLILAILEADLGFCFITRDDIPHELDNLGMKYFFTDEPLFDTNFIELRNSLEVFGKKIRLYKSGSEEPIKSFNDQNDPMNRICYTVSTSGTTGQRKIVRVTFNCIAPNVESLQRIFNLSDKDVIFSSAPMTFDVFVMDLFLTLRSGSALMILDEELRYSQESLNFMFFESTGVTFMQITPSLFQLYGLENIQKILKEDSSLKFLVLGGEKFPAKDALTWQNWEKPSPNLRIFNIYGTTEMSCWAMIHEVRKSDLEAGEVSLGELLDQTHCAFDPVPNSNLEELIITTPSRLTFIDNKNTDQELGKDHLFAYRTGDLVTRKNEKIFFYGRRNEVVKRFGERVNLSKIELVAIEILQSVACIFIKKKIVLFYRLEEHHLFNLLMTHLKARLKPSEIPDDIRKISFLPLSEHGKVSKQQLKEIYKDFLREDRERRIEAEESFLEAVSQILNLKLGKPQTDSDEPDGKRKRTDMDSTFKALGGSSFDALRISMRLEDQTGMSNGLLPKLLGDRLTIRDICSYLKDLKPSNDSVEVPRAITSSIITEVVSRFDLKKCIDATPAVLKVDKETFISVGSHSHQIITINARNLKIVSQTELKDRIESEIVVHKDCGLVGCYDGSFNCFDLHSGAIKWKFDSNGMIKSKALVVPDQDLVIFGNYNYEQNLYCLQLFNDSEPKLLWSRLVGSRGILASPLLINSDVLICTLDGTLELIKLSDGETIWNRKFESPIFSTPQIIPNREEFLVAEVSKNVHCFDFDGKILWNFQADGHIFSSFLFHPGNEGEVKILFGCHDKMLRCISYKERTRNLLWKTELQSQIYGTPRIITINNEDFVISASTSGFINFIKLSNGQIEHIHQLPGEIFSSPAVFERMIFVGCRDNFLYCIQF